MIQLVTYFLKKRFIEIQFMYCNILLVVSKPSFIKWFCLLYPFAPPTGSYCSRFDSSDLSQKWNHAVIGFCVMVFSRFICVPTFLTISLLFVSKSCPFAWLCHVYLSIRFELFLLWAGVRLLLWTLKGMFLRWCVF